MDAWQQQQQRARQQATQTADKRVPARFFSARTQLIYHCSRECAAQHLAELPRSAGELLLHSSRPDDLTPCQLCVRGAPRLPAQKLLTADGVARVPSRSAGNSPSKAKPLQLLVKPPHVEQQGAQLALLQC